MMRLLLGIALGAALAIRPSQGSFVHVMDSRATAATMMMTQRRTNRWTATTTRVNALGGDKSDLTKETIETKAPTNHRRSLVRSLAAQSAALWTVAATASLPTNAFDTKQSFPIELVAADAEDAPDSRQRKLQSIQEKSAQQSSRNRQNAALAPATATLWGAALWLLAGSRSNPVVTPLANVWYKEQDQEWLQDRNKGLFAEVPLALSAALAVIFFAAGRVTDLGIQAIADSGSSSISTGATISLQLAAVTLIGGGALELGRLASGEKALTRTESDRADQLQAEFAEFAQARLRSGGNCHRTDVVRAFRRYYAQYRQAPSPENDATTTTTTTSADESSSLLAVTDLEIEQLLRQWARGNQLKMSAAGFYTGIQINTDADVFVQR